MRKEMYPAVFSTDGGTGYTVSFPDLLGCVTEGNTLREAVEMAEDALGIYLYSLSEDGEEIDAYILGIFYPIDEFKGICKAIICRYDDNENKLIVVPKNKNYTIEQIDALLEFQERFFQHKIIIE